MEYQTKYILNQIRGTAFGGKVMTVFVEAEIRNKDGKAYATLSMLWKKKGTWLSAVNRQWRKERSIDVMTDTTSLEVVLRELMDFYPAAKHMVITAGHGSVIGINYYIPGMKPKTEVKDNALINGIFKKEQDKADFKQPEEKFVGEPTPGLLFLSNKEISEVLQKVFKEKKLDVLVMYNCLMQNLFTQYELRRSVDWFIAPISGISIPGYNYASVLNEINLNPAMDGEMVSRLFIESFRSGNRYSLFEKDIEQSWKVAAIRLEETFYNQLYTAFRELVEVMADRIPAEGPGITNAVQESLRFIFNYSYYCLDKLNLPDLGVFLAHFSLQIRKNHQQLSYLLPYITAVQKVLSAKGKEYVFQGRMFYNNGTGHKEDEPQFRDKISNLALMLPVQRMDSGDCLDPMIDEQNYLPDGTPLPESNIPSFLTRGYAKLIKRILTPF